MGARQGVLGAAAAAAVAWTTSARAEAPSTTLGWQVFAGGGARLGTTQRATSIELREGGWSELPGAAGEGQGGFGITLFDFTLDVHFQGGGYALAGPGGREDALRVYNSAIGVELGYRAHAGRFVTLNPFVGLGSTGTELCFTGVPSDASDPERSAFQQVLLNPARGTCLEATDVGLDLGLTALASFPFPIGSGGVDSQRLVGWLGVGPRFAFTIPLGFTRRWEAIGEGDSPIALPPFDGPVAPLGGAYVGVDVVFRGGLERFGR